MNPERFGKNLNEILKRFGMTQSELAKKSGVSQSMISQITTGDKMPSLEVLCRLLKVLPVKFERLVE